MVANAEQWPAVAQASFDVERERVPDGAAKQMVSLVGVRRTARTSNAWKRVAQRTTYITHPFGCYGIASPVHTRTRARSRVIFCGPSLRFVVLQVSSVSLALGNG